MRANIAWAIVGSIIVTLGINFIVYLIKELKIVANYAR